MGDDEMTALWRAVKAGERAAELGFDWAHALDALEKVTEEVHELRDAMQGASREEVAEELGDLYFAVSNVARKLGLDPEKTLHAAVGKFEHRFSLVLAAARQRGRDPRDMSLDELEELWVEAKHREG